MPPRFSGQLGNVALRHHMRGIRDRSSPTISPIRTDREIVARLRAGSRLSARKPSSRFCVDRSSQRAAPRRPRSSNAANPPSRESTSHPPGNGSGLFRPQERRLLLGCATAGARLREDEALRVRGHPLYEIAAQT
jgi:hypothetical protein